MQLQRARAELEAHGLAVAAITYDNQPTLEDFAERKGIEYALLADPTSETIRAFGMLDPDATGANVPGFAAPNVAYPGYFVLDRAGVVRERFVDARYDDRRTAGSVVARLFPELVPAERRALEAPHVGLALAQSDLEVVPGDRIALSVELALAPGVHVYAPDAARSEGFRPLELALEASSACNPAAPQYPPSRKLHLEVLGQDVPVYEGRVTLRAEVALRVDPALLRAIEASPEHRATVHVAGVLRYQACDAKECFPPCEVPLAWDVAVHALDLEQTDPALRKPRR